MQRFNQLFTELDASNKTLDKLEALSRYFREVPPEDGAWALWFLTGRRFPALVKRKLLRQWVADLAELPDWLVADSYERVGDMAETMSLLLPLEGPGLEGTLAEVVEQHLLPLRDWEDGMQLQLLRKTWAQLSRAQALVFHKLLTGSFRVGASKALVIRALGEALDQPKDVIAHRLMGEWHPSPQFFQRLSEADEGEAVRGRPYPFYLASPSEDPKTELGPIADWLVEWKWDGIRAQLLKRGGQIYLWTRGDELVTESYPEILTAAARLPDGTVLDGELLAWRDGKPLGFTALQNRLGRKKLSAKVLAENPVAFLAYDCLETEGQDRRDEPQDQRRQRLETIVHTLAHPDLILSPQVEAAGWENLATLREESRARGVEGLMLKHREAPYRAGRVRGHWWKWKIAPYTADLVMIYAQAGSGRRASLFTDYTFAAWDGEQLLPVAKAYSGLTDAEIREVDRWVKQHTLARRGPVRTVPPELVFEIAFEDIRPSTRHKSGVAMRFPRILRWRKDKPPAEAEQLSTLKELATKAGAG